MLNGNALWRAGRAGCVDYVGNVCARYSALSPVFALGTYLVPIRIQFDSGYLLLRQFDLEPTKRPEPAGPSVAQDEFAPLLRICRIKRHICSPSLEHA